MIVKGALEKAKLYIRVSFKRFRSIPFSYSSEAGPLYHHLKRNRRRGR